MVGLVRLGGGWEPLLELHSSLHHPLRCGGEVHGWRNFGPGARDWALCRSVLLHQEERNNALRQYDGEAEEEENMRWTLLSDEIKRN